MCWFYENLLPIRDFRSRKIEKKSLKSPGFFFLRWWCTNPCPSTGFYVLIHSTGTYDICLFKWRPMIYFISNVVLYMCVCSNQSTKWSTRTSGATYLNSVDSFTLIFQTTKKMVLVSSHFICCIMEKTSDSYQTDARGSEIFWYFSRCLSNFMKLCLYLKSWWPIYS